MAPAASGRRMIMRLIDADALIEEALTEGAYGYVDAKQIADAPTVDAMPVRHGQWECQKPCPVCGEDRFKGLDADIWADWEPPYCPNCGAKMDKGRANEQL